MYPAVMPSPCRPHHAPDNAPLPMRLALEEPGAPCDAVPNGRGQRQQRIPACLRLDPAGQMPLSETPDGAVFGTAAILPWLAGRHGARPRPDEPARGVFPKSLVFTSNRLHAGLQLRFCPARHDGSDPAAPRTAPRTMPEQMAAERARHLGRADRNADDREEGVTVLKLYPGGLLRRRSPCSRGETDWFRPGDCPGLAWLCDTIEARAGTRAAGAEALVLPFTAPVPAQSPEGAAG